MPASSIETLAHPHLRQLMTGLDGVTEAARRLRADLSPAQCAWKPDPGVWNVLECFQHLIVTNGLYFPKIGAALDAARREGHERPFRPSFFARRFIRFVSPESTFKIKTFRVLQPPPALADVTVLDHFIAQQDELAALIQEADAVDLNTGKFASPASSLVRFTVGEGLTVLVVHERRHLQQARRLTEHPGFPAGPQA